MNLTIKILSLLAVYLSLSGNAYAYLDPVTGSLLVQGIIALVAGIVAGVKSIRQKIVGTLAVLFKRKEK